MVRRLRGKREQVCKKRQKRLVILDLGRKVFCREMPSTVCRISAGHRLVTIGGRGGKRRSDRLERRGGTRIKRDDRRGGVAEGSRNGLNCSRDLTVLKRDPTLRKWGEKGRLARKDYPRQSTLESRF